MWNKSFGLLILVSWHVHAMEEQLAQLIQHKAFTYVRYHEATTQQQMLVFFPTGTDEVLFALVTEQKTMSFHFHHCTSTQKGFLRHQNTIYIPLSNEQWAVIDLDHVYQQATDQSYTARIRRLYAGPEELPTLDFPEVDFLHVPDYAKPLAHATIPQ